MRLKTGLPLVVSNTSLPASASLKRMRYSLASVRAASRLDTRRQLFEPVKGEILSPLDPPPGCYFHPRCPFAMDRCRDAEPLLKEVAPGRVSACHLNDTV